MAAQSDGRVECDHLHHAADSGALGFSGVNRSAKSGIGIGIPSTHFRCFYCRPIYVGWICDGSALVAAADDMGADIDAEILQNAPGDGCGGNPCGSLACAGAFQHVAKVAVLILQRTGKVGMARHNTGMRLAVNFGSNIGYGHSVAPIGEILVLDPHRDWRAEGHAVTHTSTNLGAVFLYLHPAARAVSLLTARHLRLDIVLVERQTGWYTLNDDGEPGTVRLTGC